MVYFQLGSPGLYKVFSAVMVKANFHWNVVNTNLISARPPRVKESRNIIKRKKKAEFELPAFDTVKSLPSIRHERRISPDFVPIFDINELTQENASPTSLLPEVQTTTTVEPLTARPRVSSLPLRLQPRGEGWFWILKKRFDWWKKSIWRKNCRVFLILALANFLTFLCHLVTNVWKLFFWKMVIITKILLIAGTFCLLFSFRNTRDIFTC